MSYRKSDLQFWIGCRERGQIFISKCKAYHLNLSAWQITSSFICVCKVFRSRFQGQISKVFLALKFTSVPIKFKSIEEGKAELASHFRNRDSICNFHILTVLFYMYTQVMVHKPPCSIRHSQMISSAFVWKLKCAARRRLVWLTKAPCLGQNGEKVSC